MTTLAIKVRRGDRSLFPKPAAVHSLRQCQQWTGDFDDGHKTGGEPYAGTADRSEDCLTISK